MAFSIIKDKKMILVIHLCILSTITLSRAYNTLV